MATTGFGSGSEHIATSTAASRVEKSSSMSATIRWGDEEVPVLQRHWQRHAHRLPYRKTYSLKPGHRWHNAPLTEKQWEHYVEIENDVIPAGAVIARELLNEGALTAWWTECWGADPVFISPDLTCVKPDGE